MFKKIIQLLPFMSKKKTKKNVSYFDKIIKEENNVTEIKIFLIAT